MCADRSLWVDDAYALRCRGCTKSFTWVRRKHHCRQCGQVFCANCLYTTPSSLEQLGSLVGLAAPPSGATTHAERLVAQSAKPTKVCHRCAHTMAASLSAATATADATALAYRQASPHPFSDTASLSATSSSFVAAPAGSEVSKLFTSPLTQRRLQSPPLPSASRWPPASPLTPAQARAEGAKVVQSTDPAPPPSLDVPPVAVQIPSPAATRRPSADSVDTAPVETDEERAVHLSLTGPVAHRPNRLREWLASVEAKAAADKDAPASALSALPTLPPPDAHVSTMFDKATAVGAFAEACTTFWPATGSAAATGAVTSLDVWNTACLGVLVQRTAQVVARCGLAATCGPSVKVLDDGGDDRAEKLSQLLSTLAVRALRQVAVPLGSCVTEHVALLLTRDGATEASEALTGFGFFASLASLAAGVPTVLSHPRFLLLSGDVTFATSSDAATSCVGVLEYMNTYRGYLDNYLKKIERWRPDVIVVERGMHHYLQAALAKQCPSVLLLLHVGAHQLEGLARCTGGRIVTDLSFVGVAQLASTEKVPTGTCAHCAVRIVGSRVLCVASGLRVPFYASVLMCGIHGEEDAGGGSLGGVVSAVHAKWREAWSCVLSTAYHLCAQVHLLKDMGLAPARDRLGSDTAVHAWTPNLAVAYSVSLLAALADRRPVHGAAPRLTDQLVVEQIEVGALTDTTVTLLTDNTEHTAGFPERRVLRFYQPAPHGDTSLFDFLLARLASTHRTLLFVHGDQLVQVTTTSEEKTTALTRYECWAAADELELFQRAQAYLTSLASEEPDGASDANDAALRRRGSAGAMSPPYGYRRCLHCAAHLDSHKGNNEDGDSAEAEPRHPSQRVGVCSPHTLNVSLGSFLELLLYPDPAALQCGHCGQPALGRGAASSPMAAEAEFCFVLFPAGTAAVTISFRAAPLPVHPIRLPPATVCAVGGSVYDAQEMAELVRDVDALAENCRRLTERLDEANALSLEATALSHGVAALKAQLVHPSASPPQPPMVTTADITACRWTQLQPLLNAYQALAVRPPTVATASTATINSAPTPAAMSLAATPSSEMIAAPQWLYAPVAARAVRWTEPSSLIALALVQAREIAPAGSSAAPERGAHAEALADLVRPPDEGPSSPVPQRVYLDDLRTASGRPLKSAGETRHLVTVELHLPKPFAALRELATDGHADRVTESLWRCRRYQPAGGKSHSDFFRTLDDRFLLKRIRPVEVRHFVTHSAPRYFQHMHKVYATDAHAHDGDHGTTATARGSTALTASSASPRGTCTFGKMLGVFTITRKSLTVTVENGAAPEAEHYMLVENLMARQCVLAAYDLKGSQRNRVAVAGASVVLDENLVAQLRKGQYLFVPEADKARLLGALREDTSLLVSSSIMDYSLMVAASALHPLSSDTPAAASDDLQPAAWSVGLIDYMQPYTGVKALESKMKSGIDTVLGYTNRAPTIIDPARYQHRFLMWMNRYFCGVPDRLSVPCTREEASEVRVRPSAEPVATKERVST